MGSPLLAAAAVPEALVAAAELAAPVDSLSADAAPANDQVTAPEAEKVTVIVPLCCVE